ncbi:hypothetical protein ACO22_04768 [Paracoccidioides brasiliensis]|uniref:Uncharacterized protein n=1 Tax=Paracoccidioides brasiliensis TaxID=121759 RepID=A0A1D2JC71_PARBR|nr:hypothetical protein ACO22_04768 [Paracoccidioides brasiliensis]
MAHWTQIQHKTRMFVPKRLDSFEKPQGTMSVVGHLPRKFLPGNFGSPDNHGIHNASLSKRVNPVLSLYHLDQDTGLILYCQQQQQQQHQQQHQQHQHQHQQHHHHHHHYHHQHHHHHHQHQRRRQRQVEASSKCPGRPIK